MGAYLCPVIAAERDQQLVPRGRRVQALHVFLRPLQQRRIASRRPVVLLSHLQLRRGIGTVSARVQR